MRSRPGGPSVADDRGVTSLLKRFGISLGQAVITLLLTSMIVFGLMSMAGDPVNLMLGANLDREQAERLRSELELDRPVVARYGDWLGQLVQGELGYSRSRGQDVTVLIAQRLPRSLLLTGVALVMSALVAIPAGVYSAVRRGSRSDRLIRMLAVLGQAAPSFWVGAILILIFSVRLGWFPILTTSGLGDPRSWVLPSVTLAGFLTVAMLRLVRSGMLEVLDTDYVKLARLKGAPESRVIWKHALRNAILTVLTFTAQYVGLIITVAVVVEKVFAWPGMGLLGYEAILRRDVVLIQGFVLVAAALVVIFNLAVDLLYSRLDPRTGSA
jgi:peptide/nickel transport system permease protein